MPVFLVWLRNCPPGYVAKAIAKYVAIIYVVGSVGWITYLYHGFDMQVWTGGHFWSLKIFMYDAIILACVIKIERLLRKVHPAFDWWPGRIVGIKNPRWETLAHAPLELPYLGPLFLGLLVFSLPALAASEEIVFRDGRTTLGAVLLGSVLFGLAHLFMGVRLSVVAALSLAGLWFSTVYQHGGLVESTVAHTSWNIMAVSIIPAGLLIDLTRKRFWPAKAEAATS